MEHMRIYLECPVSFAVGELLDEVVFTIGRDHRFSLGSTVGDDKVLVRDVVVGILSKVDLATTVQDSVQFVSVVDPKTFNWDIGRGSSKRDERHFWFPFRFNRVIIHPLRIKVNTPKEKDPTESRVFRKPKFTCWSWLEQPRSRSRSSVRHHGKLPRVPLTKQCHDQSKYLDG